MNIEVYKKTNFQFEYRITRKDLSKEFITLDTKTYLVHDFCHYVIEKKLNYTNGFWGLIAQGYSFKQLLGKENQLIIELREVEKVIGSVQSLFLGQMSRQDFTYLSAHFNFSLSSEILDECMSELNQIMNDWNNIAEKQFMTLIWNEKT